jgi:CubicO group peptidase (beta-lactamase class C family)
MKEFLCIIICFFANVGYSQLIEANPENIGMSSERLERITELSKEYINDFNIPGIVTIVSRKGKIVYYNAFGKRDVQGETKLLKDDLFRIYSMTKPVTAVAIMQLYEQGKFNLNDPVSKFLPELEDLKVLNEDGDLESISTTMRMHHLLTHTAGFTYGFSDDQVDIQYSNADLFLSENLKDFVNRVAKLPLKFQPGTRYHYSIAVDLTGLIIERLSGQSLDKYFTENIFEPLGMNDTFFQVPNDKRDRFLTRYRYDLKNKYPVKYPSNPRQAMSDFINVSMFSGGGGLVSSAMDYMIFAESLRNGGAYKGQRILSSKTIKFMTKNHLESVIKPFQGGDMDFLKKRNSDGLGWGIGFGLVTDTTKKRIVGSDGEYYWQGPSSIFWVDPVEEIVVISMIQIMSAPFDRRSDIKIATYQAIDETYEK